MRQSRPYIRQSRLRLEPFSGKVFKTFYVVPFLLGSGGATFSSTWAVGYLGQGVYVDDGWTAGD